MVAGLLLVVGALLIVIVFLPQAVVDPRGLSHSDWLTHVDNLRASILQGLGGLALLGTLYFSATTLGLNRRGQLADRFTKAVEQLGQVSSDNMAVRLGGIYALEQIALDDDDLHWPVMEVLSAVLRATAGTVMPADREAREAAHALSSSGFPEPTDEHPRPRLRADLQAIASVICRRTKSRRRGELRRGQVLGLDGAWLAGAILGGAHLDDAWLHGAHLEYADLRGAQLDRAKLVNTILARTVLINASLDGADLRGADLRGADLTGTNLTRAQLDAAHVDATTVLPSQLIED